MYKFLALVTLSQILITSPISAVSKPISQITAPTSAQQLFDQGLKQYQSQKYSEAAKLFLDASTAFGNGGDKLNQALTWNYLSLSYQELGQLPEAEKVISDSVNLLQSKNGSKEYLSIRAQAFNTLGRLQLAQGKIENAISSWEEAITIYTLLQDSTGKIGAQINQMQGFQALGFFQRARKTLENAEQDINQQQDPMLQATGMLSLGNTLRVVGDLDKSKTVLEKAETVARNLPSQEILAEILLSKGNTIQAMQENSANDSFQKDAKNQEVLELYQRAATIAEKQITRLQGQLKILRFLVESPKAEQWSQVQTLSPQIQSLLESLPPSRSSIYARINFAQSLMKLAKKTESAKGVISSQDACTSGHPACIAAQVIVTGIKQAQNLQDLRAEAYTLGTLGNLYEQAQQWSEAENFSKQALKISEGIQAKDISSRWFWQLGRIKSVASNPQRNEKEAILAYEEAVKIFRYLRRDLVAVNRDVQFSFRDEVEPVYREYVRLLLQPKGEQTDTETLEKARKAIESLQLAELDNFFRSACLDSQPVKLEKIESTQPTAVIYPIVLSDSLATIISLPNQPEGKSLKLHLTKISKDSVEEKVDELQQKLVIRSTYEFLLPAKDIYNLIIRPIEADLQNSGTKNLVFVLDGRLQSIPIAVLYDENKKQYMIQKGYDIAVSPGLELLPPKFFNRGRLQAIVGGITKETKFDSESFPKLPYVKKELTEIGNKLAVTRDYLDEEFNSKKLEQAISYSVAPVVHLATHGQFSSKADRTFILSGGGKLDINNFSNILKARETNQPQAIELLVLSACKTAAGDNRAALGLAGIAIQSGARSTLASLWSVNDEATTNLMIQFYQELVDHKKTKAEALRLAQNYLLSGKADSLYKHPYYWSSFVLVGNWE
ncbi:CHAT domain-containing protein [Nostoc linckia FACHB-104]|nr:CHAT domain-containing protein [Nostoc linckia FACHB-104]